MSESKKYYWLKLKRDFFKRHDIKIIENMPNGKDYILFYLKLLCESINHEGYLRFSEQIPYNIEMLSTITNTNVDIVRSAIDIFSQLNMMEILDDGTYYMNEVQKLIGSASQDDHTRESTRLRVQAFRERKKQALLEEKSYSNKEKRYSNVTCNGEIEIETELDKELELSPISPLKKGTANKKTSTNKKKTKSKDNSINGTLDPGTFNNIQKIIDLYHETCISYPPLIKLSQETKDSLNRGLENYTLEDYRNMFTKAEESAFLKGNNDLNWKASFDWLVKEQNVAKILNGGFDNIGNSSKSQNGFNNFKERTYDMKALEDQLVNRKLY